MNHLAADSPRLTLELAEKGLGGGAEFQVNRSLLVVRKYRIHRISHL